MEETSEAPVIYPNFHIRRKKDYVVLKLFKDGDIVKLDSFYNQLSHLIQTPQHTLIDCTYLESLNNHLVLAISIISQQIILENKKIVFVNANEVVKEKLKDLNIESEEYFPQSIYEAINYFDESTPEEKMSYLKTIYMGTIRTFLTQGRILTSREKISLKPEGSENFYGDNTAVSRIVVGDLTYLMAVSMSKKLYTKIVSKVLEKEVTMLLPEHSEILGSVAEGIISSSFALKDLELGSFSSDSPVICYGKKYAIIPYVDDPQLKNFTFNRSYAFVIPFTTPFGDFAVELYFPKELDMATVQKTLNS
jgi:hypothetical protein